MSEKIRALLDVANTEIQDERKKRLTAELKERLRELEAAKLVVTKLEQQMEEFLDRPIAEAVFDE